MLDFINDLQNNLSPALSMLQLAVEHLEDEAPTEKEAQQGGMPTVTYISRLPLFVTLLNQSSDLLNRIAEQLDTKETELLKGV